MAQAKKEVKTDITSGEDEVRVQIPEIDVLSSLPEGRQVILDKLNEDYPEFEHSYQREGVTKYELRAKRQEVVNGEDGHPVHHMGDPVVRQDRAFKDALRQREGNDSRDRVEAVLENHKSTVKRSPKEARDISEMSM